jgi:RNA polymerase sigma factor (sigma-70 family)
MALRFAARIIADEDLAREQVQEAILQAYLSLDRLHDPARFKGWLCGIVLNVCRHYLRDRRTFFFSLEALAGGTASAEIADESAGPKEIAEERELHQTVLEAVNALGPGDREVVLSFYFDQLSLREIALAQRTTPNAVKVRLHRARRRLKTDLLARYPEIRPVRQRRNSMIKVTVADVVKQDRPDSQGQKCTFYVMLLQDEARKRAMPIWIGPFEGQSIAMELKDFHTPRPLTFSFCASLLKAAGAAIDRVRITSIKDNTYYAAVTVRSSQSVMEIDARPSDAIALALLTGSPVEVDEDIFNRAGFDIPPSSRGLEFHGSENILKDIEEMQRKTAKTAPGPTLSAQEIAAAKQELINSIFQH